MCCWSPYQATANGSYQAFDFRPWSNQLGCNGHHRIEQTNSQIRDYNLTTQPSWNMWQQYKSPANDQGFIATHKLNAQCTTSITSCNFEIASATLFNQMVNVSETTYRCVMHSLTHDRTVSERVEHSSLGLIGGGLRLRLGLRRGERLLDGDGVDLRHVRRQRRVHHPVPLQQPLPLELIRHHLDLVARATPSHTTGNESINNASNSWRCEESQSYALGERAYPPDVSVTTWNCRDTAAGSG